MFLFIYPHGEVGIVPVEAHDRLVDLWLVLSDNKWFVIVQLSFLATGNRRLARCFGVCVFFLKLNY